MDDKLIEDAAKAIWSKGYIISKKTWEELDETVRICYRAQAEAAFSVYDSYKHSLPVRLPSDASYGVYDDEQPKTSENRAPYRVEDALSKISGGYQGGPIPEQSITPPQGTSIMKSKTSGAEE